MKEKGASARDKWLTEDEETRRDTSCFGDGANGRSVDGHKGKQRRERRTFASTKDQPTDEQTSKVLAGGVAKERNTPDADVGGHPLADGQLLKGQVLRKFEDEVREVEDGAEP